MAIVVCLALFPCLAGLTLAFAPRVVASFMDRFVAVVGVRRQQDNQTFLSRPEAVMPRRLSTHHQVALPRCIPHLPFLDLLSLVGVREWLHHQFMVHHLHPQSNIMFLGLVAHKVLLPRTMPFQVRFSPDW